MFIKVTEKAIFRAHGKYATWNTFFDQFIINSVILSHTEEKDLTFLLCPHGDWTNFLLKAIKQKIHQKSLH